MQLRRRDEPIAITVQRRNGFIKPFNIGHDLFCGGRGRNRSHIQRRHFGRRRRRAVLVYRGAFLHSRRAARSKRGHLFGTLTDRIGCVVDFFNGGRSKFLVRGIKFLKRL